MFIIPFTGLKNGEHLFEFELNDSFFKEYSFSEELSGKLDLDLTLDKKSNMIVLNFALKGVVNHPCDRCNDLMKLMIDSNNTLYVKFGDEDYQETDDIVILPENAFEIDISTYVAEFIALALPMKKAHEEGKCNPEILKTLSQYERTESQSEEIDPRWEALKKLKE